jgi:2-polyprenyl-6-methoxyphenol hydroxylase-like FAD-dependent oxidoreductase
MTTPSSADRRESPPRRVAIVGGGIGGLAAAIALRNAGHEVTVFERRASRESLRTGGGLVLWHNGIAALRRLGLAEAVEAVAPTLEFHEFRSWRGGVLARWPVGDMGRELELPAVSVSRSALYGILADAVGETLRLDRRCTAIDQQPHGVTLRFEDGAVEHADAVIGADGFGSVVRAELLGRSEARPAGYTAWQAVVGFPSRELLPDGVFTNVWGRGLRFMCFRTDADDLVYWDAVVSTRRGRRAESPESPREMLLDRFTGWHSPVRELIDVTPDAAIAPIAVADRPPARRWGAGRASLLGDAAHPMTFNLGQGACQALEDAVVLADALAEHADVDGALRAYEGRRMARTADMVTTARRIGAAGRWRSPLLCGARDAFMRVMFGGFVMRKNYELMLGYEL